MSTEVISAYGGYRKTLSFGMTCLVYHATTTFCRRNYNYRNDPLGKTVGQMIGAARSARQNLVEASSRAGVSSETELNLLDVAKASLQELLEDYIDYLRTRGHRQWEEGSVEWEAMRKLGKEHNDAPFFMELCETRPPETIANMAIILINQADYLLFKQLERLEKDFVTQGGFSERMMRVRKEKRGF